MFKVNHKEEVEALPLTLRDYLVACGWVYDVTGKGVTRRYWWSLPPSPGRFNTQGAADFQREISLEKLRAGGLMPSAVMMDEVIEMGDFEFNHAEYGLDS